VVFLGVSGWIAVSRGEDLLGMEFRAGTAVTLNFKTTGPAPKEGEPAPRMKMDRPEVERKVKHIGESAKPGSPLKSLAEAQVIAVNPDANNIRSDTFTIKSKVTDPGLIHDALVAEFQDSLDVLQGLSFEGSKATPDRAPAFPITSTDLGHSIEKPGKGGNVAEFRGGLAIVLDHLKPTVSRQELVERLAKERSKADFADTSQRHVEVRVLEGSEAAVSSAVVLVSDPDIRFEDRQRWTSDLRDREWKLATRALTESEALAGVQSFSPAIAKTFATQGFVCTLLSLLLLTVYVFVRFGTLRWAVAATVPLFADVIGIVGLLGLAQILYLSPSTQNWAAAVGLRPFDLDLAQIAAVLTIVGYSLNDKIIILDRIRENKGKLAYASKKVINDSINQTLSRTCITAGAHMITTIALYMFGGESVRGFAYTFNLGVLLGTYTSIVSTPLVWSAKSEPGTGGSGDARLSEYGTVPGASVNGDRASVDASRPAA
jgi:preprotein translocase SecF subunit